MEKVKLVGEGKMGRFPLEFVRRLLTSEETGRITITRLEGCQNIIFLSIVWEEYRFHYHYSSYHHCRRREFILLLLSSYIIEGLNGPGKVIFISETMGIGRRLFLYIPLSTIIDGYSISSCSQGVLRC